MRIAHLARVRCSWVSGLGVLDFESDRGVEDRWDVDFDALWVSPLTMSRFFAGGVCIALSLRLGAKNDSRLTETFSVPSGTSLPLVRFLFSEDGGKVGGGTDGAGSFGRRDASSGTEGASEESSGVGREGRVVRFEP